MGSLTTQEAAVAAFRTQLRVDPQFADAWEALRAETLRTHPGAHYLLLERLDLLGSTPVAVHGADREPLTEHRLNDPTLSLHVHFLDRLSREYLPYILDLQHPSETAQN